MGFILLFMTRTPSMKVEKWITSEELKKRIRTKEKDVKVLNRLHFVNYLYSGCSVPEISEKLGITKVTGYNWLERWNEDGYDGLIPRFCWWKTIKTYRPRKNSIKRNFKKKRRLDNQRDQKSNLSTIWS